MSMGKASRAKKRAKPAAAAKLAAEEDARMLARAGEVLADKKRHAAAKGHMLRQHAAMKSILTVRPGVSMKSGKPAANPASYEDEAAEA
jgi:hypothetical protein